MKQKNTEFRNSVKQEDTNHISESSSDILAKEEAELMMETLDISTQDTPDITEQATVTKSTQTDYYDGKNFLRKMTAEPLLSAEEERALAKEYFETKSTYARDELILRNQRLVAYEAAKYQNHGLSYEDLIQEGNIGLMRAVEKFDYRLNNRFSTYALWWIKQAMLRAIENDGSTIRIPVHTQNKLVKLNKFINAFRMQYGREPSETEIIVGTDFSSETIQFLKNIVNLQTPFSISSPLQTDDDSVLEDVVPDTHQTEDRIGDEVNKYYLSNALKTSLTEKERYVLTKRYGLDGEDPMTLEEVGNILGLTKERIRQIQRKAERKLSRNKELRELFITLMA